MNQSTIDTAAVMAAHTVFAQGWGAIPGTPLETGTMPDRRWWAVYRDDSLPQSIRQRVAACNETTEELPDAM